MASRDLSGVAIATCVVCVSQSPQRTHPPYAVVLELWDLSYDWAQALKSEDISDNPSGST